LKSASGAAGAEILPAKFFDEFLIAVHDAIAAAYLRFGRESFAALTAALERRIGKCC